MRFVPIKTVEQQAAGMVLKTRLVPGAFCIAASLVVISLPKIAQSPARRLGGLRPLGR
jgi:hypothetical protein